MLNVKKKDRNEGIEDPKKGRKEIEERKLKEGNPRKEIQGRKSKEGN